MLIDEVAAGNSFGTFWTKCFGVDQFNPGGDDATARLMSLILLSARKRRVSRSRARRKVLPRFRVVAHLHRQRAIRNSSSAY